MIGRGKDRNYVTALAKLSPRHGAGQHTLKSEADNKSDTRVGKGRAGDFSLYEKDQKPRLMRGGARTDTFDAHWGSTRRINRFPPHRDKIQDSREGENNLK